LVLLLVLKRRAARPARPAAVRRLRPRGRQRALPVWQLLLLLLPLLGPPCRPRHAAVVAWWASERAVNAACCGQEKQLNVRGATQLALPGS
jgi:hypothetical protein